LLKLFNFRDAKIKLDGALASKWIEHKINDDNLKGSFENNNCKIAVINFINCRSN
jgi:hypothetical protein